jgi:hypothetical protein
MKLLNSDPAAGNGTPPKAAETAANGLSEREILLERKNRAQAKAISVLKEGKKKAEETAATSQRKADELKRLQEEAIAKAGQQPKTEESSWGFFV